MHPIQMGMVQSFLLELLKIRLPSPQLFPHVLSAVFCERTYFPIFSGEKGFRYTRSCARDLSLSFFLPPSLSFCLTHKHTLSLSPSLYHPQHFHPPQPPNLCPNLCPNMHLFSLALAATSRLTLSLTTLVVSPGRISCAL